MKIKAIKYMISLLLIFSCGRESTNTHTNRSKKSLNLINGITSEEYPSVVQIRNKDTNLLCTGTFIQKDTVLTAAHCVIDGIDLDRIELSNGMNSQDIYLHEEYKKDSPSILVDLALVKFPFQEKQMTMTISSQSIISGDKVIMTGFGLASFNDNPTNYFSSKQLGNNLFNDEFDKLKDGIIAISGLLSESNLEDEKGENTSIAQGDSGGPLFVKEKGLVGIAIGQDNKLIENKNVSYFNNIHHKTSNQFLLSAQNQGFINDLDLSDLNNDNKSEVSPKSTAEQITNNTNSSSQTENEINKTPKKTSRNPGTNETGCGVIANKPTSNKIMLILFLFPLLFTWFNKNRSLVFS